VVVRGSTLWNAARWARVELNSGEKRENRLDTSDGCEWVRVTVTVTGAFPLLRPLRRDYHAFQRAHLS
jgi:hypothetical protein